MDYYFSAPPEDHIDDFEWYAQKGQDGVTYHWPRQKRRQLQEKVEGGAIPPHFYLSEVREIEALAALVQRRGGLGQFDFDAAPIKDLLVATFQCGQGHKAYGYPRPCRQCDKPFCQEHIEFILDKWMCLPCRRALVDKCLT